MAATDTAAPRRHTFRIRFLIEGVAYTVIPLQPDPTVATRAYRMLKLDARGKTVTNYDVRQSPEGTVERECKGFLRWKSCKHVRTLRAAHMLDQGG